MDLGLFRRASQGFASRADARLDYGVLVATLDAHQAASPTARAQLRDRVAQGAAPSRHNPLVELLIAGSDWREAQGAQGGCFNRAQAERLAGACQR